MYAQTHPCRHIFTHPVCLAKPRLSLIFDPLTASQTALQACTQTRTCSTHMPATHAHILCLLPDKQTPPPSPVELSCQLCQYPDLCGISCSLPSSLLFLSLSFFLIHQFSFHIQPPHRQGIADSSHTQWCHPPLPAPVTLSHSLFLLSLAVFALWSLSIPRWVFLLASYLSIKSCLLLLPLSLSLPPSPCLSLSFFLAADCNYRGGWQVGTLLGAFISFFTR